MDTIDNLSELIYSYQSKPPVTILQEICSKLNPKPQNPKYEEINTDSQLFIIKCSALGKSAIGEGVSKKDARHAAAANLLNIKYESTNSDSVSDLHNICLQKNLEKPTFHCKTTCGPTNARSFTVECRMSSIRRTATSDSIKKAEKLAATAVLEIVQSIYPNLNITNSYWHAKQHNKFKKLGTSLMERHNFNQWKEEKFIEDLIKVLTSSSNDHEKYEQLLLTLTPTWPYKITKLGGTDIHKFELMVDEFPCLLLGTEDELWIDVLEYFSEMLNIKDGLLT